MRQKLWSIAQSLRLPSICTLCNQFHKNSLSVCFHCMEFIIPLSLACQYCAYPLPDKQYLHCGQCIKNPPAFDKALIAYTFEEPLRSLLHQFKYHDGLYLGTFISELMLKALDPQTVKPQCLIPVPMHPKRLKERGFNQAAILTRLLAKQLNLPYDLTSCQKIINTAPQASLNGDQRQKNIHKAFFCQQLPYEHVTIIDDLLTTGSTANELARTLKKEGVKTVDIWCCARTISK
jgi:ComF family protein